ncbi:MAG: hypothetical protein JXR87_10490, partial [Candidatus Marinimicrobia bacterium]|nr:hypothetical protein [Candidatus Neomarinimicrobiota bacterium]
MKKHVIFILVWFAFVLNASDKPATVLIRCDDIGMCHAVNVAAKEVAETGLPLNFSIMFVCPW